MADPVKGRGWPQYSADDVLAAVSAAVEAARQGGVDPAEITRQRELGWPDFHPEDYCHKCGMPNPHWFTPDWHEAFPGEAGIVCPRCFTLMADPEKRSTWLVTRYQLPDENAVERLAAFLRSCTDLDDDAERVAACILNAGYSPREQETGE